MKKTKTQKGITLIALIITIIILLILAVVTIGSIKNSNIITYAQNAANKYNIGKSDENTILGEYEDEISKYYSSKGNNETSAADYYWYEENSEGGITILGPKKIKYTTDEKIEAKIGEIIDSEFGEGKFDAYLNDEITDEDLYSEISAKEELLWGKIAYSSQYEDIYDVREISKEEVGKNNLFEKSDLEAIKIYSTERLPESIDGKPVTQIGDYAFEYINVFNGEFIPNTVKVIGTQAFRGSCFKTKLVIPDSIVEIKSEAFRRMQAAEVDEEFEEIPIQLIINDAQNNLVSIGDGAFEDSPVTGTLNLRSEISIASNAFNYTNVTLNRK